MAGLIYGAPNSSATFDAMGVDAIETSTGQVLGAVAGGAFDANPAPRILRAQQRGQLQWQDEAAGLPFAPPAEAPPKPLDPQEANDRFGIKGHLKFDAPVSEDIARGLHDERQKEIIRQDIIERRTQNLLTTTVGRGAVGLAMGLLDPVNVGAGFIPIVGPARAAAMVGAAAGLGGRIGVRTAIGAGQGAVSMAALEPMNALLDQQEMNDWHMSEALRNIAFGGLIGGGLHVVMAHPRAPLSSRLESLAPEDRIALLQAGIAQHVDGAPVNVAPLLDTAELQSAFAARMAARGDTGLFGEAETSASDVLGAIANGNPRVAAVAQALEDAASPRAALLPEQEAASRAAAGAAELVAKDRVGDGATAELFPAAPEQARTIADNRGVIADNRGDTPAEPSGTADQPPRKSPETAGNPPGPALSAAKPESVPAKPVLSPELQEATRLADKAIASVRAEIAAGRMTEANLAPLRAADAAYETALIRGQAAEAAASCLIAQGAFL